MLNMTDPKNNAKMNFPCKFPIKIVGMADVEFQGEVLKIFRQYFSSLPESAVTARYSKENKYISMTVVVDAESQEQLDGIYRDLSANKLVLMAL